MSTGNWAGRENRISAFPATEDLTLLTACLRPCRVGAGAGLGRPAGRPTCSTGLPYPRLGLDFGGAARPPWALDAEKHYTTVLGTFRSTGRPPVGRGPGGVGGCAAVSRFEKKHIQMNLSELENGPPSPVWRTRGCPPRAGLLRGGPRRPAESHGRGHSLLQRTTDHRGSLPGNPRSPYRILQTDAAAPKRRHSRRSGHQRESTSPNLAACSTATGGPNAAGSSLPVAADGFCGWLAAGHT
jgi:hypothetical protein